MRKLLLILFISILCFSAFSQGKLERYSCKTPVVTITGSYLSYVNPGYYWYAEYSVNTFNCRCISSGIVAGYFNSTPDYNYLGNITNETPTNLLYFQANTGNQSASANQIPFYARAYVITADGIFYSDNVRFSVSGAPPLVSTVSVSSIGTGDAYSGGSISSDGGNTISGKGVVWGYDASVSLGNYIGITSDGSGSSSYTSHMTGLSQGTAYYVKAYATNSIGTGYGNAIQFTTQQSVYPPTVITADINSINQTSAYSGGSVSYSGGGSVTERGVCWNTVGSPNTSNSKTSNGTGVGSFLSFIDNLSPNTTYYVRAYAKASGIVNGFTVNATGYGQELSFTTTNEGLCTLPTIAFYSCSNATASSVQVFANISSDEGCAVTSRGFDYCTDGSFTTILGSVTVGSGTGSYDTIITGLECNTRYYFRPWVTNSVGTCFGINCTDNVGTYCTTTACPTITANLSGYTANPSYPVSIGGYWTVTLSSPAPNTINIPITITDGTNTGNVNLNVQILAGDTIGETSVNYYFQTTSWTAYSTFGTMPTGYSAGSGSSITIPAYP